MKQTVPDKSTSSTTKPKPFGKVLRKDLNTSHHVSVRSRVITGALTGLMLCAILTYWLSDTPLWYSGTSHRLKGSVYMDLNADQNPNQQEPILPFVKLNLYSDLNDNRQLDESDLWIGSSLTDKEGNFDLRISHGRTYMTRIRKSSHEAQENLISNVVQSGQPLLTLGGDDNVSGLVALRFEGIDIPSDAKINQAFIRIRAAKDNEERPLLWISGEANSKSKGFEVIPGSLSGRTQTQTHTLWECHPWIKDRYYSSPDLSGIIAEIQETGSWDNQGSLTFFIEGQEGIKEAYSATSYSPQLVIHYDLPSHDYLLEIDPTYAQSQTVPFVKWLDYRNHQALQIPFSGTPPVCFSVTEDQRMALLNYQTGMSSGFPPVSEALPDFQQILVLPSSGEVWALKAGIPGRLSIPEGEFSPLPFADTPWLGMAVDPYRERLIAITAQHAILEIDPATRQIHSASKRYPKLKIKHSASIQHLVFHPTAQKLFYLQPDKEGRIALWQADLATGKVTTLGLLKYQEQPLFHVLGMVLSEDGTLTLITGNKGPIETQNLIAQLSPETNEFIIVEPFPNPLRISQCGCHTPLPNHLQGLVMNDLNGNSRQESTEQGYAGVRLYLYVDENANHLKDEADTLIHTVITDEKGTFSWKSYEQGPFLVELDSSSLPEAVTSLHTEIQAVDFHPLARGKISPFLVFNATPRDRIVPLNWVQLSAQKGEEEVRLKWSTVAESDEGQFTILRSFDGISYEVIAHLDAHGPNNQINDYLFIDQDVRHFSQESVAAYRIQRNSALGESYSEVVKVNLREDLAPIQLETTPGTHRPLRVRYRTLENGMAQLRVINLSGRVIYHREVVTGKDHRQIEIANQGWRAGIYYLQLETPREVRMKKIVVK